MDNETTIVLVDIPLHEESLLKDEPGITLEKEDVPAGAFGEPVTFTLAATSVALVAVAGYLYRKSKGESFEEKVTIRRPDGTYETREVKWKKNEHDAPKNDVLKHIVELLKHLAGM